MTSSREVSEVLHLMKQAYATFPTPIVTQIGEVTKSPFQVLISCILSLRTKDEVTLEASKRLFAVAATPDQMVQISPDALRRLIYPVGFYKTKAKNILQICRLLLDRFNGKVPENIDRLMDFPGVGRKTAAITMVYGFGHADYIPADVHVHVIANRLGWVRTKKPEETEQELMTVVPKQYWMDLNTLFVAFGQHVCLTVSPFCSTCPVKRLCKRVGVTRSR